MTAAAAAVVVINKMMSLLCPCLSTQPLLLQGVKVDQVWKLIAPAIVVAEMAMVTFTAFIG